MLLEISNVFALTLCASITCWPHLERRVVLVHQGEVNEPSDVFPPLLLVEQHFQRVPFSLGLLPRFAHYFSMANTLSGAPCDISYCRNYFTKENL